MSTDVLPESPTAYIENEIGKRYARCRLDAFRCDGESNAAKTAAIEACRDYAISFDKHHRDGVSLVLIGPKGTGKDHLMSATIMEIARRLGRPGRVVFRDGLKLFAEFRSAFNTNITEQAIVDRYQAPALLALSDPLPPRGELSEFEQRMLLRIVDSRYREMLPLAATCNVSSRDELETRIGVQAADRILDHAIVVKCNWESFRKRID